MIVSGLPSGATLSAGTPNPDGSYTLTPAQLSGLTLTPPDDFSGSLTLTVKAVSTDGTATAATTAPLTVTVTPVADAPTLTVTPATGAEDMPIGLSIVSSLTDSSETLSVIVSGLPSGASLSAGTPNPDGSYTLTPAQLSGLTLTPPDDFSGTLTLTVKAISTDGTATAETTTPLTITVTPVADTPTLAPVDTWGAEHTAISLTTGAALTDTDGSETLSVTLSSIPQGASLAVNGTTVYTASTANGSFTLSGDQLHGLTLTPPENFSGEITLGVAATATDGSSTTTTQDTLTVDVRDTLTLTHLDEALGLSDSATPQTVTVSDLPTGSVLSAGTTSDGGQTWSLSSADLEGLQVTAATDTDFQFKVEATPAAGESAPAASVEVSVDVGVFEHDTMEDFLNAISASVPPVTVAGPEGALAPSALSEDMINTIYEQIVVYEHLTTDTTTGTSTLTSTYEAHYDGSDAVTSATLSSEPSTGTGTNDTNDPSGASSGHEHAVAYTG
ncbi:Ig-like domain-containing protein [Pararhodospirillum photometricum]|uniref:HEMAGGLUTININ/HEMOLYSIN-RELATED PROTEIN n=1 Tax=Pararhodospirillum photometricum DSM 122 TaxID=1150469 RepID=H6SQ57_PARPM|nr:Ig-like domain-containing protein [Pararhodospirillum photometricum]CCG09576.1 HEMAGGLUTININ/HEMOLYSIN-RELATED PROTEIN [Pararhodospirillum photometricum DSM 122]